jgi:hypothetical protein
MQGDELRRLAEALWRAFGPLTAAADRLAESDDDYDRQLSRRLERAHAELLAVWPEMERIADPDS